MLSFKDRLSIYKSSINDVKNVQIEDNNDKTGCLSEILKGSIQKTHCGKYLVKTSIYNVPYAYGHLFMSLESLDHDGLAIIAKKDASEIDFNPDRILFLDTETTGLSGGTGTYIFLMGLGYFKDNHFVVKQYFMPDYGDELAFLQAIMETISHFDMLVTYNGKSFDIPLLITRLKYNRIHWDQNLMGHLDLLHCSRQVWKHRLDSCSLQSIERSIMGKQRFNDIPGAQIPGIYFDYLSLGNMDLLPLVIEHNQMDIISLACLAGHLSQWVKSQQQVDHLQGMDYYGMGKLLCSRGKKDAAISFFQRALNCSLPPPNRCSIYKELGSIYKSLGDWVNAVNMWKQVIDEDLPGSKFAFIELAKYYEHKTKEYNIAILTIEKYLIQKQTRNQYRQLATHDSNEDLKIRLKRLNEKLSKLG
jgi:uncharacterized protein